MRKNLSLSVFISVLSLLGRNANGQTTHYVWGVVEDSSSRGLPGSSVVLKSDRGDSTLAVADSSGIFLFQDVKGTKITVAASSVGYQTLIKHFMLDTSARLVGLDTFRLGRQDNLLKPVVVNGVVPMTIKEDTIEYNVAAYKVRDNAMIEDVLRKLPGVDVDADGNITAQGKPVTRAKVNGKDFFGGDVKTATKNIPADMVENVQIIDDYGEQEAKTGIKTGDPEKVLNINTRADKSHGYTAQGVAGDGSDLQPRKPGVSNDNRYVGSLSGFELNGKQQLAVLGNLNNTNNSTFTFGSVSSGISFGGGGGGQMVNIGTISLKAVPSGAPTGTENGQNGITVTRSIGANYRDDWGKAITSYGSYSFAGNTVDNSTHNLQENTSLLSPGSTVQTNNQTDNNVNHRVNWTIDYEPDNATSVKFSPFFGYQSVVSETSSQSVATIDTSVNQAYASKNNGHSSAPSLGLLMNYNHHFQRTKENLNINVSVNQSTTNQFSNPVFDYTAGLPSAPAYQQIASNNQSTRYNTSISFIQPLGAGGYLEFLYSLNYSTSNFNKITYISDSLSHLLFDSSLSTIYDYTYLRQRGGLNYRNQQSNKYNYTVGIAVEPGILDGRTQLEGLRIHTRETNIIPAARFVYNFEKSKVLSINYSGSTSQPSFVQLQPVIDFSNAIYPVEGNPDLRPQFTSRCSLDFNDFSLPSGNSFFANLALTQIQNKIITSVTVYPSSFPENPSLQGTYLARYLNANGYYTGSASLNYSKPWDNRKYTLMLMTTAQFINNIGYLSNVDTLGNNGTMGKNIARTLTIRPGFRFRVDLDNIIDAQVSANYAINKTTNSINNAFTNATADFRTLTIGINGKNYFKDWTISYDFTKAINYGYALPIGSLNIFNTYIERRSLKGRRGTIRLAVFDLFNQNAGYSAAASATSISETSNMRLGRYILASFSFRIERFSGQKPSKVN